MAKRKMLTMDGNEAAAHASYAFTEVAMNGRLPDARIFSARKYR